jgi:hypothetical protein
MFGKTAVVSVVGNDDCAHSITASMFQALNDCGLTAPPGDAFIGTAKR